MYITPKCHSWLMHTIRVCVVAGPVRLSVHIAKVLVLSVDH